MLLRLFLWTSRASDTSKARDLSVSSPISDTEPPLSSLNLMTSITYKGRPDSRLAKG